MTDTQGASQYDKQQHSKQNQNTCPAKVITSYTQEEDTSATATTTATPEEVVVNK